MIEFDNAGRRYGNKAAVDGLSLRVRSGELFALLGPNGAGKTTAVRMLVGLLRPSEGTVRVCGEDVAHRPHEAVRRIGYVPDEPYLYDKLSGREFLEFVGRMRGLDAAATESRIARQSEHFGLSWFLDELTETYSHGMKQRLVFAAAMLHDPPALVLDEPMVGLDPQSIRLVKDLLRERVLAGSAVFMSTHTLAIAEEIADRIGIVDAGRLRFLGTVSQLREELASEQTGLEPLFLELISGGNGQTRKANDEPRG